MISAFSRRAALPSIEILEARIAPAAANLNLASLNGANGFKLLSEPTFFANGVNGQNVSDAGDVNHDEIDDFIIGASQATPNGGESGAAYVVFGKMGGFNAALDLTALNGGDGFEITGGAVEDFTGRSVSAAGDVNGDTIDDIIVGAYGADANGASSGAAYVIFGRMSGFPAQLAVSSLDGINGFRIVGEGAGDSAGHSVSGAGDVNGDGFDDVLIGAPGALSPSTVSGAAYIIFGKASGFTADIALSALNGINGFKITAQTDMNYVGLSVSGAGDVNGDTFDDIIVGAPKADLGRGAAYVVFGHNGTFTSTLSLGDLTGINGFKLIDDPAYGAIGVSVSAAGDVNHDGHADVIVASDGRRGPGNVPNLSASYVIFGKNTAVVGNFAANLNLSALDVTNGFKMLGRIGDSDASNPVSSAGDLNGDGVDDLLIGADGSSQNGSGSGESYVVFGKDTAFEPTVHLTALNGTDGFTVRGAADGDHSGFSLSGAGDVNKDGFDDFLVGSRIMDRFGVVSGASYVVFGFDSRVTTSGDGSKTTVTDGDGDIITIKLSNGQLVPQDVHFAMDGSIASIDLTHSQDAARAAAAGSVGQAPFDFVFKLKKHLGDGIVKLGMLDATDLNLGTVKIAGDLGGIKVGSGIVGQSDNGLGKLVIGSLTGIGTVAGTLGTLKVKHDITGVLNVTGGPADEVGQVESSAVFINKVVVFGNIDGSAGGEKAGLLRVRGGIGSVVVKGSVIGGADLSGIVVGGSIGKIEIGGDLTSADPAKPVTIGALGNLAASNATEAVALHKLTIGGAVLNAQILAGYKRDLKASNSDAGIGKIIVTGDWSASSIAAGVEDSTHDGFGRNDTVISGDITPALLAQIASIIISGTATGSASSGADFFGITAQQIGAAKISGMSYAFTPNQQETGIDLDQINGDFRLVEV